MKFNYLFLFINIFFAILFGQDHAVASYDAYGFYMTRAKEKAMTADPNTPLDLHRKRILEVAFSDIDEPDIRNIETEKMKKPHTESDEVEVEAENKPNHIPAKRKLVF